MWTPQYDIIVETLTGSEFEMTVTDKDTVGYIKSRIQKYEGIPIGQQHLLYNHKELSDTTEMKDIPLVNGSRLKLVLDMKGGPVSARRVVSLPDYDNWFDLSDVLNTSRHDPLTISTPGVKLLLYKDCKKNVHRIMKLRSDRKTQNSAKTNNENATFASNNNEQWVKDNLQTLEKMHQLRMQLELKKKDKDNKKHKDCNYIHVNGDTDEDYKQKTTQKIDLICESLKNKMTFITESSQIKNDTNLRVISKLSEQQQYHQQKRRNSFFEFPIPILPKRSSSSGLLNKYGLNKTCVRPPSFISQEQQQQQKSSRQQKQQRKNENTFFPLHALSPLLLPPLGSTLSSSPSSSKFVDVKSTTIIENNVKENTNHAATAIKRPIKQLTKVISPIKTDLDLDKSKLRENIQRNRSFKTINAMQGCGAATVTEATATGVTSMVASPSKASSSDGDLLKHSNLLFNTPFNNRSLSSMIDQIFNNSVINSKTNFERQNTSKSVQDLIEKIAITKQKMTTTTMMKENGASANENNGDDCGGELNEKYDEKLGIRAGIRFPKLSNCVNSSPTVTNGSSVASNGFENTLFIDKHTLSLNTIDTTGGCVSNDFKLEATTAPSITAASALDNGSSFRLYKVSSTEAKNSYELPKLLIREDSPVDTFHLSDPQLETLTIRGESPKNSMDTFSKLNVNDNRSLGTDTCTKDIDNTTTTAVATSKTIIKTPWNHHHSDLGLNNLELNFLNEEYSDLDAKLNVATDNCDISNSSVLKIASNLEISSNCWNSNSYELDGQSQPSTTSLNFINGDITSSDDDDEEEEENLFSTNAGGSCCMLHSNSKSKSIELNDFRMMFGSSPTLLNSNYNSIAHTSRLDAVPIQYRRGYTNLNDACLSSSTSDLELFNGSGDNVHKKNSSKSASQELPSAFASTKHYLHHHLHHHHKAINNSCSSSSNSSSSNSLDFVRSYENLDRAKILRMKNEQYPRRQLQQLHNRKSLLSKGSLKRFWDGVSSSTVDRTSNNNNHLQKNLSREKLQEEDFYIDDDIDFSYANLGYENALITTVNDVSGCDGGAGFRDTGPTSNNNLNNVSRTNDYFPLATRFPSDENLFDMNLDNFTDEYNLLSTLSLTGMNSGSNNNNYDGGEITSHNINRLLLSPSLLVQTNENDDDNQDNDEDTGSNKFDQNYRNRKIKQGSIMLTEYDVQGKSTIKKVPSKKKTEITQVYKEDKKINEERISMFTEKNDSIESTEATAITSSETLAKTESTKVSNKPEKQRCAECNKKLGIIMVMKCHCEKIFCTQHRYAEAHNCSYNFKLEGKKILSRENPLVIAQKLPKI